ncbi:periodic tryptophan protein 1 like [Fagus crenata]
MERNVKILDVGVGIIELSHLNPFGHSGSDEDDEEMDVDAAKEAGEVAQALEVADALGRTSNIAKSKTSFDNIGDGLRELDMENYDEEDDGIELFSSGLGDMYYPSNDLDPYLKDKDVWIYQESDDGDPNVYVHHDIIISANPLCTAWLDYPLKGGEKGNFIAVGSMEPSIEIWDLDIIDEVQPCVVLGGIAERKEKKKKKEISHHSYTTGQQNILASASGDKRVKIWDVATGKCNNTMEHHTDKVQAVAWNHHAPQVILTGSFDRSIVMKDGRMPEHSGYNYKWSLWDLSNNQPSCIASTNPQAGAVFSVSFSEDSPFLLAIGGSKGNLEVWDTLSDAGIQRRFGNYIKQKPPQPSLEDE